MTKQLALIACTALAVAACGANSQTPVSGAQLYTSNCAACHGLTGEGDGPVADVLRVSMPNLRTLSMRNNGRFPLETVRSYIDGRELPAAHGDRYMPVWGEVFGADAEDEPADEDLIEQRLDALTEHLQELQYR